MFMKGDPGLEHAVLEAQQQLDGLGVQYDEYISYPISISPSFFVDRKAVDTTGTAHSSDVVYYEKTSAKMVDVLTDILKLDDKGYITVDPRQEHTWRGALRDAFPEVASRDNNFEADKSLVSEELNVAYCHHEMFADGTGKMTDFFLKQASGTTS